MSDAYDVIIIGLGGMGSAAAYHLAKRGQRVLGLEAFGRGHAEGASHGRTRIIREAYSESPEYMPLVRRAYHLWRELELESGQSLLRITGGVAIGPAEHPGIQGVLTSARAYDVAVELLTPAETTARFPAFRPTDDLVTVFQPNSGILAPEACTRAHILLAERSGATLHYGETVRRWTPNGAGVEVETTVGQYTADRLVITAGPWAGQVLKELDLPLSVARMYNVHFEPIEPGRFDPARTPVYGWELPEGDFYGMPALPGQGLKFGRHDTGEPCTPETANRIVSQGEIEALRQVLDRVMPGAAGRVLWTLTCLYTLSPDHHFVLDRHPRHDQVVFGCGFSGHGFKFACAVGEILADLAITGSSQVPIGFFSSRRFSPGQ